MVSDKTETEINDIDKQIGEINEWQKNAYNPGYYIGSGRIPIPLKNLYKKPVFTLILGAAILIATIYYIVMNFNIHSLASSVVPMLIGDLLFINGIIKIFNRKS